MEVQIKVGVLIQRNGRLLLIKERHKQNRKYRWNIIKGTFEPKTDRDVIKVAHREAAEEASARVKINHLLNIFFLKRKNKFTIQFNFIASLTKKTLAVANAAEQKQRGEDISEMRFFSKEELTTLRKTEFISARAYRAVQDWLKGKRYHLDLLKILFE